MATHTPGPWLVWTSNSWRRIRGPNHEVVCEPIVQHDGHPDLSFGDYPQADANSKLIVAAPDLAKACATVAVQINDLLLGKCEGGHPDIDDATRADLASFRDCLNAALRAAGCLP
jgi:hypothetical protein